MARSKTETPIEAARRLQRSRKKVRWIAVGWIPAPQFAKSKPWEPTPAKRRTKKKALPKGWFTIKEPRVHVDRIRRWCDEWGAEWARYWDGSYDAQLTLTGNNAWDVAELAASTVPGPALVRYVARYTIHKDDPRFEWMRYRESSGFIDGHAMQRVLAYGSWRREHFAEQSLLEATKRAVGIQPDQEWARVEVRWPREKS